MKWYDALKDIKAIIDSDLDAIADHIDMKEAVAASATTLRRDVGRTAARTAE